MSPQRNKLTRQDIRSILVRGQRVVHEDVSLAYQSTKNKAPRFIVVIGSKIDKRATRRNRAKRCMREAICGHLQKNPLSFDGAFFIKRLPVKITTRAYALLVPALIEKIKKN